MAEGSGAKDPISKEPNTFVMNGESIIYSKPTTINKQSKVSVCNCVNMIVTAVPFILIRFKNLAQNYIIRTC